jgi:hypothetical protein
MRVFSMALIAFASMVIAFASLTHAHAQNCVAVCNFRFGSDEIMCGYEGKEGSRRRSRCVRVARSWQNYCLSGCYGGLPPPKNLSPY